MITLEEYEALLQADWFDPSTWTGRSRDRLCFCPGITLAIMRGYELQKIGDDYRPYHPEDDERCSPLREKEETDVAEAFGFATWDEFDDGLRDEGSAIRERLKKPEE